ncbi:MAG: class E sortase [Rubrobacter sp.]
MPWTSEFEINTTSTATATPTAQPSERPAGRADESKRGGSRHRSRPVRSRQNPRRSKSHASRKTVYRRRRAAALAMMLAFGVVVIAISSFVVPGLGLGNGGQANAAFARVEPPLLSTAPVVAGTDTMSSEVPADKTLSLTVPKLGLYGNTVEDDDSAEALDAGAIKIPETGFPWQENANTYISGHRIGYAGTESYYQFLDLPKMKNGDEVILEDANGNRYTYRVFEVFAVEPTDVWVTEPIAGRDIVTLQTCTETVDDWTTLGPELMYSSPDTGRLIVRAERV